MSHSPTIRLAEARDLPAIAAIYGRIHDAEASGRLTTGWLRDVYPTEATARAAIESGDMYVLESGGVVVASARINGEQMPAYRQVSWLYPARDDQVLVLHTLTVDPLRAGQGFGGRFLAFYEALARDRGCLALRIDTNARNAAARAMYAKKGYVEESGVILTVFNGIPDVQLVCLEKAVCES